MKEVRIQSLEDTRKLAEDIVRARSSDRLILLLDGAMGAGKTRFTRDLVVARGGDEEAVSPSFAIHNRYPTPKGVVDHVDLFRLESEEDLESTGFWDLFSAPKAWVVIEWSDRLSEMGLLEALPRQWPKIQLRFRVEGQSRVVSILD